MPIDVRRLDVRRFDPAKMQKLNLFETPRFFCDVYCLEPGQAQKPHAHDDQDKIYLGLEGRGRVSVGGVEETLEPGEAVVVTPPPPHAS